MSERSLENIYPTLFIGMGGAGGQVLGLLSRLLEEEFGTEILRSGASPLQFLLLDTDDFEKLPSRIRKNLRSPERDFLSLSNFNPRRYAERQMQIPDSDLHRWFDPDALPYLEDTIIHDGASRLRLLGRLCLHYRYHEVEQRIREKLDAALDATVHARAQRIRAEPRPVRVLLIASSLGGTGSAIFVDIAAMANRIARDRGTTPDAQGFVFLPFLFIEKNAQIDAALEAFYQHNAWAFFSELNHLLKHPDQLPEYVLDPHRPYGHRPRPFDYGRDLLRTIYLLGDRIPPVGTLEPDELFAHVAHGIFHVFLTPEEGAMQSTYSNIKAKLKEPDQIFGDIKRFATFGYSEYRTRSASFAKHLAWNAARRDWEHLLGREVDPGQVQNGVQELSRVVEESITELTARATQWSPPLPTTDAITGRDLDAAEVARRIEKMPGTVQASLEEATRNLDPESLGAQLRESLERALSNRLADPPLGMRGEVEVIRQLRERLRERAAELGSAPVPPAIDTDPAITDLVTDLVMRSAKGKSVSFLPSLRSKPVDSAFRNRALQLRQLLLLGAVERLKSETGRVLFTAIQPLTAADGLLERHLRQAETAMAVMGRYDFAFAVEAREVSSPTVQDIPTRQMLEQETASQLEELYRTTAAMLHTDRRAAWAGVFPRLLQREETAPRELFERLVEAWSPHALQRVGTPDPLELVRRWSDGQQSVEHPGRSGGKQPANPLQRLFALSYPLCPLDESVLHKGDTVPKVTVGVGPFRSRDEATQQLGAPGSFQLIGQPRSERIAVLQTWYAFASRAVEGMETLRRSYLDRQQAISLPHTTREWNRGNLGERSDGLGRFADEDLLQVGRALALSRFFRNAKGNGNGFAISGLHVERDGRDSEPLYLLEYGTESGHSSLRWRDLIPVEGFSNRWRLVYRHIPLTNGNGKAANGNGRSSTGWNPERDLGAYLASETRQRHTALLDQIARLERSTEYGAKYVGAYKDYLGHLTELAKREEKSGRQKYLPLLRRLSDVLHGYVEQLGPPDRPGL